MSRMGDRGSLTDLLRGVAPLAVGRGLAVLLDMFGVAVLACAVEDMVLHGEVLPVQQRRLNWDGRR